MSDSRKAFEKWADTFNTESDEWQDMEVDKVYEQGWRDSRQALKGEPFTWVFTDVNGEAKEIAGDPVHRSPQDLRIYTALYTHPASVDNQAVSVPQQWRDTMEELAADLESEIENRRSIDLNRRIERGLIVVREARALLAEQEKDQ